MTDDRHVLHLAPEAHRVILEEARARYPEECCGGLIGTVEGDRRRAVVRAVPVGNEQDESRERRYLVGPREVLRLEEIAESDGMELLGFFHSHPDHPAIASETDRKHAWPWYSYVIVAVDDGETGDLRSWRLEDDRASFEEEAVNLTEGAKGQS